GPVALGPAVPLRSGYAFAQRVLVHDLSPLRPPRAHLGATSCTVPATGAPIETRRSSVFCRCPRLLSDGYRIRVRPAGGIALMTEQLLEESAGSTSTSTDFMELAEP